MSVLVTIITSAAVASLVSATMQLIGAHLERRARRRELLLARAPDLAAARTENAMRIAKEKVPALRVTPLKHCPRQHAFAPSSDIAIRSRLHLAASMFA
jgi:hypothetical protein